MRLFFPVLIILISLKSSAQHYSSVVNDTAITKFMYWLIKSDTVFKNTKHIDKDIMKLQVDNFRYADSGSFINQSPANNIFTLQNKLTTYFTRADANYFVTQIKKQRRYKWGLKIKGIKLLDTIELVNNHTENILFSYSLPIFSSDKNYVIIIEAFFCGLVCGGGEYNLYERQQDNSWKKIKQFNQWAE